MQKLTILLVLLFSSMFVQAQNPVNWTTSQLREPADLAARIKSGTDLPLIISVGPDATIPGSVDIGMVNDPTNLKMLRSMLKRQSRSKEVVVFCGCCPFEHCPNVRPTIALLRELKFTNYSLLNLPHNIKIDWIDKGYPVKK